MFIVADIQSLEAEKMETRLRSGLKKLRCYPEDHWR